MKCLQIRATLGDGDTVENVMFVLMESMHLLIRRTVKTAILGNHHEMQIIVCWRALIALEMSSKMAQCALNVPTTLPNKIQEGILAPRYPADLPILQSLEALSMLSFRIQRETLIIMLHRDFAAWDTCQSSPSVFSGISRLAVSGGFFPSFETLGGHSPKTLIFLQVGGARHPSGH